MWTTYSYKINHIKIKYRMNAFQISTVCTFGKGAERGQPMQQSKKTEQRVEDIT